MPTTPTLPDFTTQTREASAPARDRVGVDRSLRSAAPDQSFSDLLRSRRSDEPSPAPADDPAPPAADVAIDDAQSAETPSNEEAPVGADRAPDAQEPRDRAEDAPEAPRSEPDAGATTPIDDEQAEAPHGEGATDAAPTIGLPTPAIVPDAFTDARAAGQVETPAADRTQAANPQRPAPAEAPVVDGAARTVPTDAQGAALRPNVEVGAQAQTEAAQAGDDSRLAQASAARGRPVAADESIEADQRIARDATTPTQTPVAPRGEGANGDAEGALNDRNTPRDGQAGRQQVETGAPRAGVEAGDSTGEPRTASRTEVSVPVSLQQARARTDEARTGHSETPPRADSPAPSTGTTGPAAVVKPLSALGAPLNAQNAPTLAQPIGANPALVTTSSAEAVPTQEAFEGAVSRGISAAVRQNGGSLTLRLDPPMLGSMTIRLSLDGGQVSAQFEASTPQAQQLLQQHTSWLRSTLEAKGLAVERLHVQMTPHTHGGNGASSDSQSPSQDGSNASRQRHDAGDGQSRGHFDRRDADHRGDGRGWARREGAQDGAAESAFTQRFRISLDATG